MLTSLNCWHRVKKIKQDNMNGYVKWNMDTISGNILMLCSKTERVLWTPLWRYNLPKLARFWDTMYIMTANAASDRVYSTFDNYCVWCIMCIMYIGCVCRSCVAVSMCLLVRVSMRWVCLGCIRSGSVGSRFFVFNLVGLRWVDCAKNTIFYSNYIAFSKTLVQVGLHDTRYMALVHTITVYGWKNNATTCYFPSI